MDKFIQIGEKLGLEEENRSRLCEQLKLEKEREEKLQKLEEGRRGERKEEKEKEEKCRQLEEEKLE